MKYLLFTILLLLPFKVLSITESPINKLIITPINAYNQAEFEIRVQSKLKGFNEETAVRVAKCESQLGKYDKNMAGSGATGLYQFKPYTWKHYCKGDINNDSDQIDCFIKLYPSHKDWWECK